jgi:CRP/FNR family transcriptional regulator, cyclic AMP receptor protein
MAQTEHVDHLARIDLFSGCSKKELREIARRATEVTVPAGTTVVSQGEVGRQAYVILDGKATVRRGRRKVAELNQGAPIGELALLDRGPRTAYVVADTDMRLLKLDADAFRAALEASPSLSYKLLSTLATRVRELDRAVFG